MPQRAYSAVIVMHNGHKSWSLGCVSKDQRSCEWLEGLDEYEMLSELENLTGRVQVVPAREVHGADIMDTHTKLAKSTEKVAVDDSSNYLVGDQCSSCFGWFSTKGWTTEKPDWVKNSKWWVTCPTCLDGEAA